MPLPGQPKNRATCDLVGAQAGAEKARPSQSLALWKARTKAGGEGCPTSPSLWLPHGAREGTVARRLQTGCPEISCLGRRRMCLKACSSTCDPVLRSWPDKMPSGWPSKGQQKTTVVALDTRHSCSLLLENGKLRVRKTKSVVPDGMTATATT